MTAPSEQDIIQRITAVFRQIAAYAAVVLGAIPQLNLPNSVRVPLVSVGGIILAIEHYVSDPSTGTPPKPPA
jgi:hypothetical protein